MLAMYATGVSRGVAIGPVMLLERVSLEATEHHLDPSEVEAEVARFQHAIKATRRMLQRARRSIPAQTPSEVSEFLDAHLLILEDHMLGDNAIALIRQERCNAEWALRSHRDQLAKAFNDMDDPYLASRIQDVDQVVARILRVLRADESTLQIDQSNPVVVADDVSPADLSLLAQQGIAGLVTEHGGPLAHTAILARSLGLPTVVGAHSARTLLLEGETIVVDGEAGVALAALDRQALSFYRGLARDRQTQLRRARRRSKKPIVLGDKERVSLLANIDRPEDAAEANEMGAEGVGLFRSEYLFLHREESPGEEEQYLVYRGLVEESTGPVTIRTLDLGSDKMPAYASDHAAANPALSVRAVRLCLADPKLFDTQLRAILRASAHGEIAILIPMLTCAREIFQVRSALQRSHADLLAEGLKLPPLPPLGGMIEVPAAAIAASLFAKHLDFLSIGTNDLIQYTLAIDRADDRLGDLYDPLHPAILKLIRMVLEAGEKSGKPVSMCGEMAGEAEYARLLLGLGLRGFSMHPRQIADVRAQLENADLPEIRRRARRLLRSTHPERIRDQLRQINAIGAS